MECIVVNKTLFMLLKECCILDVACDHVKYINQIFSLAYDNTKMSTSCFIAIAVFGVFGNNIISIKIT